MSGKYTSKFEWTKLVLEHLGSPMDACPKKAQILDHIIKNHVLICEKPLSILDEEIQDASQTTLGFAKKRKNHEPKENAKSKKLKLDQLKKIKGDFFFIFSFQKYPKNLIFLKII